MDGGHITKDLNQRLDRRLSEAGSTDSQVQSKLAQNSIQGEVRYVRDVQWAREFNSSALTSSAHPNKVLLGDGNNLPTKLHEAGHLFGNGDLQLKREGEGF